MNTAEISEAATLLLVLLNPFLLAVYLLGIIRELRFGEFCGVMVRGAIISGVVFITFAVLGDYVFTDILHVRYAAFLVFGGVVFLIVGIRFVFQGPHAVEILRGPPEHVAGSVAMPFMIGPGTINASILAGSRLSVPEAAIAIAIALVVTVVSVVALKRLHDVVSSRNEQLVERYVEICGRVASVVIGTIAVELIFQGIEQWIAGTTFYRS